MSICKFIPAKTLQWKYHKYDEVELWIAGNNTEIIIDTILKYTHNIKHIKEDILKNILISIDYHFGIIIITKNWSVAATDCVRSYPIFWKKTKSRYLISPQANRIAEVSNSIVDENQRLAFQMSGYTIGSFTLWKNINNINPGEFIIFNNKKELIIKKYFQYKPWKINNHDKSQFKKHLKIEIKSLISKLIKKADGKTIIVPLSAGLDSRLIASGLREFNYKNVKCFSYGLKNNYESKASETIAKKLGYNWVFVEMNIKISKNYFQSSEYKEFLDATNDGCATPSIQDVYAINILLKNGYIKKNDIIVNGNSGDFISGGHIPQEGLKWGKSANIKSILDTISEKHLEKHYGLWEKLLNKKNKNIIKRELEKNLINHFISNKELKMIYGLLELLEFENRQCKYVINLQRVYDFYKLNWLLPLWDKSFINFWANVPIEYKIDQKLYKETLEELNMGQVWDKQYNYKYKLHSKSLILLRFLCKIFFVFIGKNMWHKFDRKYILYWTDNLCGQAILSYTDIIRNKYGARHSVSWHALKSEENNLKSNWQNIKL